MLAEKLHFKLQLHWRPGGQTMGEPLLFVIYQYHILILNNIYALCNMLYMTCASLYAQCFIQYALLLALGGKVKQCIERAFVLCFFCSMLYMICISLCTCIMHSFIHSRRVLNLTLQHNAIQMSSMLNMLNALSFFAINSTQPEMGARSNNRQNVCVKCLINVAKFLKL